jgi:hypothetical protein
MLSVEDIRYAKSEIKVHPQDMIDMSVYYNESRNNSSGVEKFATFRRKVYICKLTKVMGINVNNDLGGRNCGSFLYGRVAGVGEGDTNCVHHKYEEVRK